eukprot:g3350.t1
MATGYASASENVGENAKLRGYLWKVLCYSAWLWQETDATSTATSSPSAEMNEMSEIASLPTKRVILLHVPKTGGLGVDKTLRACHLLAVMGVDASIPGHRQAIGGHLLNRELKQHIVTLKEGDRSSADLTVGGTAPLASLVEFLIRPEFTVEHFYVGNVYNRTQRVHHFAVKPELLNRGLIQKEHLLPTDYVRFENLEADYDAFCKKYGFANALALRLVNTNPVLQQYERVGSFGEKVADLAGNISAAAAAVSSPPGAALSPEADAFLSGRVLPLALEELERRKQKKLRKLDQQRRKKLHQVKTRYSVRLRRVMERLFADELRLFGYSYQGWLDRETERARIRFQLRTRELEDLYGTAANLDTKSWKNAAQLVAGSSEIDSPPQELAPALAHRLLEQAEVLRWKWRRGSYYMHSLDIVDVETKSGYGQWLRQSRIQNLTTLDPPARSWMTTDMFVHPRLDKYVQKSVEEVHRKDERHGRGKIAYQGSAFG